MNRINQKLARSSRGARRRVPRAQTHYEVLGVSRFATQLELRAAYVALMKRHHPDRHLQQSRGSDASAVQAIAQSYGALKDPNRRSQYDLSIGAKPSSLTVSAPVIGKNRWYEASEAVPILSLTLLIIVGLSLVLAHGPRGATPIEDGFASPFISRSEEIDVPIPQDDEGAAAETRAAIAASASSAMAISTNCYAAAREVGSLTAADRCVIFDAAYAYWHQNDNGAAQIAPYFQTTLLQERAITALAGLGVNQAATRMDALRSITFASLLRQVSIGTINGVSAPSAGTPSGSLPAPRPAAKAHVAMPHQPRQSEPVPK